MQKDFRPFGGWTDSLKTGGNAAQPIADQGNPGNGAVLQQRGVPVQIDLPTNSDNFALPPAIEQRRLAYGIPQPTQSDASRHKTSISPSNNGRQEVVSQNAQHSGTPARSPASRNRATSLRMPLARRLLTKTRTQVTSEAVIETSEYPDNSVMTIAREKLIVWDETQPCGGVRSPGTARSRSLKARLACARIASDLIRRRGGIRKPKASMWEPYAPIKLAQIAPEPNTFWAREMTGTKLEDREKFSGSYLPDVDWSLWMSDHTMAEWDRQGRDQYG
ncbi:hypothetical protein MMC25_006028 [Agyrium rufum]|nr:hypothetical protein [Agyrium rufum]